MDEKKDLLYLVGGVAIVAVVLYLMKSGQNSSGLTFVSASPASVQAVESANLGMAQSYNDLIKTRVLSTVDLLKTQSTLDASTSIARINATADVTKTDINARNATEQVAYQSNSAALVADSNAKAGVAVATAAGNALVAQSSIQGQTAQHVADQQASASKTASNNNLFSSIFSGILGIFGL